MLSGLIKHFLGIVFIFVIAFAGLSCKSESIVSEDSATRTPQETGRVIYQTKCISCHNVDPKKSGSLGPDVAGSSLELLRAKIIHGTYPPGYTPKKDTMMMRKFPELEKDLDSLFAYLSNP